MSSATGPDRTPSSTPQLLIVIAWLLVSIPLVYGLVRTIITAAPLFSAG